MHFEEHLASCHTGKASYHSRQIVHSDLLAGFGSIYLLFLLQFLSQLSNSHGLQLHRGLRHQGVQRSREIVVC